jgi:hypothetical protein
MALKIGGLSRVKIKYPNLQLDNLKIIGYGAGHYFSNFYPLIDIPIEYTIAPDNHGKIIHGVKVEALERIQRENPENILVIIFGENVNEITNEIGRLGPFKCVNAFVFGSQDIELVDELIEIGNFLSPPLAPTISIRTSDIGFFYQGPIFPFTELALAYQRLKFPDDYHCFVTWSDQSPSLLEKCNQWVDKIIKIEPPKNGGLSNRNFMINSAAVGAKHINEMGFNYSVRVRSGALIKGDVRSFIDDNFINNPANKNKIGFYMGSSWKNIPFHISDMFMISTSENMMKLWGSIEDIRTSDAPEFNLDPKSHFSELAKVSNESYIWKQYAKACGYKNETLKDYLTFMVENLIPLEPDLFQFSLKHLSLFNVEFDNALAPDIKWWQSLITNFDIELSKSLSRYNSNSTIDDYWRRRIG